MTIKDLQELVGAWEHKYPAGDLVDKREIVSEGARDLATAVAAGDECAHDQGERVAALLWGLTSLANEMEVDLTESLIDHLERRGRQ